MTPMRDLRNLLLPALTVAVGLLVTNNRGLLAFIGFLSAVTVVVVGITLAARYRKLKSKQH
jgi:hypothetical protein